MTTAAIVYHSRTGTTRQFAEEIGDYLAEIGVETRVESVQDCDAASLAGTDLLLLGCWTSGLFVVLQHPEESWVEFARRLPRVDHARTALFTTYTLATGSMFRRMRGHLAGKVGPIELELKSRDGHLQDGHRRALQRLATAP